MEEFLGARRTPAVRRGLFGRKVRRRVLDQPRREHRGQRHRLSAERLGGGPTRLEFKQKVRKVRAVRPDISLSSDFIVGFPGETEQDFRETLALVLPYLRGEAAIRLEDRFYLASAAKLSAALRRLDNAVRHVMIVAHNPGIQEAALALSAEDLSADRQAVERKFPTAALAQIDFAAGPWSAVEPHCGTLVRFVTPHSLAEDAEA